MREYKIYKLKLYKTQKGLIGIQDYLSDKALSERHYNEELDTGRTTKAGKPIYSGKIYFETETLPPAFEEDTGDDFKVKYYYDVVVEEDDKAKKTIKSCDLVIETTDIIQGTMSPVRRTKPKEGTNETKPYVFFSYSIDVSILNGAENKQDFIDYMKTRGLQLSDNTYQDKFQFSGFYSLFDNQIPVFSPLAYKTLHYLVSIQQKGDKYYINNINPTSVFANGNIILSGTVEKIEDNMVTIFKKANYEELKSENATLLPYMSVKTSNLVVDENQYYKEMTFKVNIQDLTGIVEGGEISVELSEDTFKKVQNSKISVEKIFVPGQEAPKEEEPAQEASKQEAPVQETPKQEAPTDDNADFDGTPIKEDKPEPKEEVKKDEEIPF
jgi:hypothetical protein